MGVIQLIFTFFTIIFLYLFPVPSPPQLKGPYKRVGTMTITIPMTLPVGSQLHNNEQSYDLTCQVWFPYPYTSSAHEWWDYLLLSLLGINTKATLWTSGLKKDEDEEMMRLLTYTCKNNRLPTFALSQIALANSNSVFVDPASNTMSQQQPLCALFPAAVYSHGMYAWRQINSTSFESLASNGLVVFSLDHKPSAMCARPYGDPSRSQTFDYPLPAEFSPGSDSERVFYNGGAERRGHEISCLFDFLQKEENAKKFHIVSDKFHLFGHSFGAGSAVVAACTNHSRVASCSLLDSWMYCVPDRVREKGCKAPLMMVSSELWDKAKFQAPFRADLASRSSMLHHQSGQRGGSDGAGSDIFNVTLLGSDHQNYCDTFQLASKTLLGKQNFLGTIDLFLMLEIRDNLILQFMKKFESNSKMNANNNSIWYYSTKC